MAKQRANLTTIGQFLGDTQQPYMAAPLIAAPFSSITDLSGAVRRMPDPSQSLRPALGIERIMTRSLVLKQDETDSAGRPIWEADNKDARIRFAGNWIQESSVSGVSVQTATNNDYMEVSFYGTGLNLLTYTNAVRDARASVDGGAEGANIYTASGSAILTGRNYSGNVLIPVVSGLSLGNHTVRIRFNGSANSLLVFGVEILNLSSSNIIVPKGSVISAGDAVTIANQTSTAFNSVFDGNPVLNGRGGRVVVYATPEGRVGKVIQQVDASQLNLASANHANEEVIRRISFREFGANRADDFSTLTTNSNRAFTLDDGTTTLVGQSVNATGPVLGITDNTGLITITFVGTGLDIVSSNGGGVTLGVALVNGTSVGNYARPTNDNGIVKIVSGLPYGTHTVRLTMTAGGGAVLTDFIIYGPKKPTIPDNAVQLAEYNLMANYSGAGITGTTINDWPQTPVGALFKANTREHTYVGAGWTLNFSTILPSGFDGSNTNTSQPVSYTFFGTGFVLNLAASSGGTYDFSVNVNGSLNSSGIARSNASNLGGGSYRSTSTTSGVPCRLEFTGLALGVHTVTIQKTAGAGAINFNGLQIITPIHFPANKVGSMSIGDLELINRTTQKPALDLSKAKAWLVYDGVNQVILASNNIASVLRFSTGEFIVHFEKQFKTANFAAVTSATKQAGNAAANTQFSEAGAVATFTAGRVRVTAVNGSGTYNPDRFSLVCFGELEGE